MTQPQRQPFTSEELKQLETEIAERFPGWVFVGVVSGGGEFALSAEKLGTHPDRQCAMSPDALLDAIEWRINHLRSVKASKPVVIHDGVVSSST